MSKEQSDVYSVLNRHGLQDVFESCLAVVQKVSGEVHEYVLSGKMRNESAESGGFKRIKTNIDTLSNRLFAEHLSHAFPKIPILSEENLNADYTHGDVIKESELWFVVDPIDGTIHLMNGGTCWLINLALCIGNKAVMGFCAVPDEGVIYAGCEGGRAFVLEIATEQRRVLSRAPIRETLTIGTPSVLDLGGNQKYLDLWQEFIQLNKARTKQFGTSYSLLKVADGELDVFANFSGNFHWDTAAQQVILECAGCSLVQIEWGVEEQIPSALSPLRYETSGILKDDGHIAAAPNCPKLVLPKELRVETPRAANWWSS